MFTSKHLFLDVAYKEDNMLGTSKILEYQILELEGLR